MKRMRPITRIGASAMSLAFLVAIHGRADAAGDVKAGRDKAQQCEVCHGLDGMSKIPEAPNIAGQNENYMIEQLNAFKTGERKNDMMSMIAPMLSPDDINNLAAYYAAIEITVGKIPGQSSK
jgi:cytochrome c553